MKALKNKISQISLRRRAEEDINNHDHLASHSMSMERDEHAEERSRLLDKRSYAGLGRDYHDDDDDDDDEDYDEDYDQDYEDRRQASQSVSMEQAQPVKEHGRMKTLAKKISHARLGSKKGESALGDTQESRKISASISIDGEEPRDSSASTAYESLQQILSEPKPPTHKGKSEWKKKEETFKEKLIRKFTPKKSKASMSYQAEDIPPVPPIPLAYTEESSNPALDRVPARHIPQIRPHKRMEAKVDTENPTYGCGADMFHETTEEQDMRIARAEEARAHRQASNYYLSLTGQRQTSDTLIGRPPPIPQDRIYEELQGMPKATQKRVPGREFEENKQNEECRKLQRLERISAAKAANAEAKSDAPNIEGSKATSVHLDTTRPGDLARPRRMRRATESSTGSAPSLPKGEVASSLQCPDQNTAVSHGSICTVNRVSTPERVNEYQNKAPLPNKGSRFHEWDVAYLSPKNPVIVPPTLVTPSKFGLPPQPLYSPPPVPDSSNSEESLVSPLHTSNVGISGASEPEMAQKAYESGSDYEDGSPEVDSEPRNTNAHNTVNDSESLAQLYRHELNHIHEGISRDVTVADDTEIPVTQTVKQAAAGGMSPFDTADDERRRVWANAANNLCAPPREMSSSLSKEQLFAKEIVRRKAQLEEEGDDAELVELQGLGSVDDNNRAIEPLRELDSDIPQRIGGDDESLSSTNDLASDIPPGVVANEETVGQTKDQDSDIPRRWATNETLGRADPVEYDNSWDLPPFPDYGHSPSYPDHRYQPESSYHPNRDYVDPESPRHPNPRCEQSTSYPYQAYGGSSPHVNQVYGHADSFGTRSPDANLIPSRPLRPSRRQRNQDQFGSTWATLPQDPIISARPVNRPRPDPRRFEFRDDDDDEDTPPPLPDRSPLRPQVTAPPIPQRSSLRRQQGQYFHEKQRRRVGASDGDSYPVIPSVENSDRGRYPNIRARRGSDRERSMAIPSLRVCDRGRFLVTPTAGGSASVRGSERGRYPDIPSINDSDRGRYPSMLPVQSQIEVPAPATSSSHSRPSFSPSTNHGPVLQPHPQERVYSSLNPRPLPVPPLRIPSEGKARAPVPEPVRAAPLAPKPVHGPSPASEPVHAPPPGVQSQPPKRLFKDLSFLDKCLAVSGVRPAKMENLQVRPSEYNSVKTKAVEDARQMQATVLEIAKKTGKDPPKYALLELIGKGTFGRVYKGKDMTSAAIVAVKIIDIDESDTLNPRTADALKDFLNEVNALQLLSQSNAKNINHVIEALPVGNSMWMISEHCGGGSVATLMKPTYPGGLQEKWIIPILREVAEAIKWVHEAGIIHRDIKCANVLVTEEGGVQLCDFGVAGIVENKVDKRSTVIGTPHWMAPELFGPNPIYGKEVDIWAFGAMIFEIATGLPPHVADGIGFDRLATYVQNHTPRLEGGNFSNEIRDLVAYCLEELPSARPTIEEVQKHPYIYNTSTEYPTSMLSQLVRAFRLWEDHGGSRKSLFMAGGAQGPSANSAADDEWNFSTTAAFDQEVLRQSTPQDVFEAYGKGVALQDFFAEETSRPTQKPSRRRPPPEALARLPAPLEKIFDPNTMSNYEENSRSHYGKGPQQPASDLPLRDVTSQTSIRDTMIDLGGHDSDTGLSSFPDMDTIKANRRGVREEEEDDYSTTLHNFSRPALSDPADVNPNRRTQDWKFPTMAPPASADPEISRFPTSYELPRPAVTPAFGGRPALIHHPTEPIGAAFVGSLSQNTSMDRLSMRESLIDLDMSMPDPVPSYIRPSTANSDAGSATSEQMTLGNPFEFERHASLYVDAPLSSEETALTQPDFSPEDSAIPARLRSNSAIRTDINEISDFSGASDVESGQDRNGYSDSDMPPPPLHAQVPFPHPANQPYTFAHFPDLPPPPSARAFSGEATHEEMKDEFNRLLGGMTAQLESFRNVYSSPQVTQRMGPNPNRRDRKDGFGAAGAPNG